MTRFACRLLGHSYTAKCAGQAEHGEIIRMEGGWLYCLISHNHCTRCGDTGPRGVHVVDAVAYESLGKAVSDANAEIAKAFGNFSRIVTEAKRQEDA